MAGSITVSSITLDSDNNFSIKSNTGATLFFANTSGVDIANSIGATAITSDKILSIANTKISGNIISSQITSIGGSQITANTIANSAIQTGAVESYLRAVNLDFGLRNRIINGDMRTDQRNAGTSVTVNSTGQTYPVDRFFGTGQSSDGVFTLQQSSTVPAGFAKSVVATVTTADASIGASQNYLFRQRIEGYNIADLNWGSADARPVTLSFWVRSSLTGTFGGTLHNSAGDRFYPYSYTISTANTWEQKTITLAGDTTGTWLTTDGIGLNVIWSLGTGSTLLAPSSAWTATTYTGFTGQTNLIGTLNATFYITGVQLEEGLQATPFEYRHYTTELALCQRYYYSSGTGNQTYTTMGNGWEYSSTAAQVYCPLPVPMRVTPTSVSYNALQLNDSLGSNPSVSSLTVSTVECSTIAGKVNIVITGGNAGAVCMLRASNSTSGYIAFNAEL